MKIMTTYWLGPGGSLCSLPTCSHYISSIYRLDPLDFCNFDPPVTLLKVLVNFKAGWALVGQLCKRFVKLLKLHNFPQSSLYETSQKMQAKCLYNNINHNNSHTAYYIKLIVNHKFAFQTVLSGNIFK